MGGVTLDDRSRLTLPKEVRERYGENYHIVQRHDGIELVSIAEDPLEALRDEFEDVDKRPPSFVRRRGKRPPRVSPAVSTWRL